MINRNLNAANAVTVLLLSRIGVAKIEPFKDWQYAHCVLRVVLFLLIPVLSNAQNFPVSGNAFLKIPSPFLSDYSAPDNTDLQITLLYTDINNPVEDVRLRIRIEGSGVSVVTRPNAPTPIITLSSGLPVVLTGADLAPYLNVENLIFNGYYSAQQYRSNAALKDGFYSICVDVYSAQTNLLLSQGICTQAFLSALEPPILNYPAPCGTILTPTDPTHIVFSWTPMHSSPAMIEYDVEFFWVPKGSNPNDIAINSRPWYSATTFATAYQYGFSDFPLQVGETYAWRVRARDVQGRSLFVRNGVSPICHFVHGVKCIPPIDAEATVEGAQRVVLTWENEIVTIGSTVEYREYEGYDPKWYPIQTSTNRLVLTNVKPSTKYEWRVFNRCGAEASSATPVDTFTTRPLFSNNRLSCNQHPNLPPVDSTNKLLQLRAGDKVKIGDFVVTIVTATGSNGRFSGACTVPVNLLNTSVNGDFSNLGVNSNYEAYNGEIDLRSATASVLPDGVREQVQGYLNNINTALENIDGGLGTAQGGIQTGNVVLGEINHILENENLPDDVRNGLNEVRNTVQNAVNSIQTGDSTGGLNILSGIGNAIENILNGGNLSFNLKDIFTKKLNETKDSLTSTRRDKREKITLYKMIDEYNGFSQVDNNQSDDSDNLSLTIEEYIDRQTLALDDKFSSLLSTYDSEKSYIAENEVLEMLIENINYIINNPDELTNLIEMAKQEIKSIDLKSIDLNKIGKESIEKEVKLYIHNKISNW